jgi:hypothetical protein
LPLQASATSAVAVRRAAHWKPRPKAFSETATICLTSREICQQLMIDMDVMKFVIEERGWSQIEIAGSVDSFFVERMSGSFQIRFQWGHCIFFLPTSLLQRKIPKSGKAAITSAALENSLTSNETSIFLFFYFVFYCFVYFLFCNKTCSHSFRHSLWPLVLNVFCFEIGINSTCYGKK